MSYLSDFFRSFFHTKKDDSVECGTIDVAPDIVYVAIDAENMPKSVYKKAYRAAFPVRATWDEAKADAKKLYELNIGNGKLPVITRSGNGYIAAIK